MWYCMTSSNDDSNPSHSNICEGLFCYLPSCLNGEKVQNQKKFMYIKNTIITILKYSHKFTSNN